MGAETGVGRRDLTNDIVFHRAEFLYAGRVDGSRLCVNRVLGSRRTSRTNRSKQISALRRTTGGTQDKVDDAGVG